MARKCKCRICGETLTTDTAYKINNNGKNFYYCDSIEYENHINELENKVKILEIIDEILGYKCVNTIIYKELAKIYTGFNYKEILNCLNKQKDIIADLINVNGIEKEFHKIRYIFTVIDRNISDDTNELNRIRKENNIKKIQVDDLNIDNTIEKTNYKYKESNSIDFTTMF